MVHTWSLSLSAEVRRLLERSPNWSKSPGVFKTLNFGPYLLVSHMSPSSARLAFEKELWEEKLTKYLDGQSSESKALQDKVHRGDHAVIAIDLYKKDTKAPRMKLTVTKKARDKNKRFRFVLRVGFSLDGKVEDISSHM
ncbi:MAG: hypothetical protein ABI430_05195 [Candidatus Taylorbacteria bacterium]